MPIDPLSIALAIIGIVIGGIVKGATGAGAPIVAVPLLAVAFDVPTAVTIFTIPNLISNMWQAWQYREHNLSRRFILPLLIAAFVGAGLGTVMLISLPSEFLTTGVAIGCIAYIAFRLARPDWSLSLKTATRVVAPVGLAAGVLQGAIGVSAPISVTFLSALKLDRPVFIATISAVFVAMSYAQIPLIASAGLMTPTLIVFGFAALGLVLITMPLGAALAQRWSPAVFSNIILVMLAVIALRLLANLF
ncbi:sulfite exporter TauE/SafE family protein [Rhodobacteraceae bacterium N5(2021)]|uniref:Probable membrane transporter protein n=2 Tax=Gymnodinialimonas phycosphaerae TaxID=2841589 RepID=A0A975U002_9RHOB|nr:sulfite exporter TauE/SafE family protein [Gymnodinialimonas phycosphaerae]